MSGDVCAALGLFRCFQVAYDGVPDRIREDMFEAMERVFDLPDETKRRNMSDKPYFTYNGRNEMVPRCTRASGPRTRPRSTRPRRSPSSCGLMGIINSGVMKYDAPTGDSAVVLPPHTDKDSLTILCQQEEVQGLEACNNGRMPTVKHGGVESGKEAVLVRIVHVSEADVAVKVVEELVDEAHRRDTRRSTTWTTSGSSVAQNGRIQQGHGRCFCWSVGSENLLNKDGDMVVLKMLHAGQENTEKTV
ncbi:hypothetical protein QJS10_CPA07g00545 [Acorus calamus]|uniref:Non-haem dioxygenase N-terminal domain-containing protein n=1 Tax=Acorus calamus TaxID=4465 RepID=A0AAV9EH57_ACOCL|nr:hypothetical protein QJS10_CPA07g00545 [Acorus calamus]